MQLLQFSVAKVSPLFDAPIGKPRLSAPNSKFWYFRKLHGIVTMMQNYYCNRSYTLIAMPVIATHNLRARSVESVSKRVPTKITWSSFSKTPVLPNLVAI